jgi:transcriptional regulator with PAS, ATPase and Fis domain
VIILHDQTEVNRLRSDLEHVRGMENIVGTSAPMRHVFALVREVAQTDATVLIEGETGTGKELVANAIHQLSERANNPMISVNCAALPEGLLESELFGHVKGAFTGAVADRGGRFEMANGGTLFLDEVADIPALVQVKLLRVLQDQVFERVGEGRPRKANVRLVSATNKNLLDVVAEGRFREDLYYRLNVFPIRLPPLRERQDDIPLLIDFFLRKIASKSQKSVPAVSDDALKLLRSHQWLGNVRELQAALEYASIRSHGEPIDISHLPAHVAHPAPASAARLGALSPGDVQKALLHTRGNRSAAAAELGISRITLWRRMKEWELA